MLKLLMWINSILFPKRCGFCGASIPEKMPLHICPQCLTKLPVIRGSGKQILKGHIDFVLSPFCYKTSVCRFVHEMKFHGKHMLSETLAAFMAERLVKVCDLKEIDVVMPVPMTKKKLSRRGYNPAALLARSVARRCDLPYEEGILCKVRETKPQSKLPPGDKRILNVRDAFACKTALEDVNVLLVDDVFTTGNTVKNCAKALKVAGAGKIIVLTAAQAHANRTTTPVRSQRIQDMVFRVE